MEFLKYYVRDSFLKCHFPPIPSCISGHFEFVNQDIMDIAKKSLYPVKVKQRNCTIMILDNLVEPQWILVDCDKPFLGDVLCSVEDDFLYLSEKSVVDHICPQYSVLINKTCYIFSWLNTSITYQNPCVAGKMMKEINFMRFKVLFDAINVEFPPILSTDLNYVISYQRYFNTYKYERYKIKNSSVEGIYICSENVMPISKGDNIFMCTNGTYISQQYVCDGFVDCPEYDGLDEMGCKCYQDANGNYSAKCKWLTHPISKKTICSGFYFLSQDGKCTPYQFISFNNNIYEHQDVEV